MCGITLVFLLFAIHIIYKAFSNEKIAYYFVMKKRKNTRYCAYKYVKNFSPFFTNFF